MGRKCFKPYYKWNTFNTLGSKSLDDASKSFKPYYKWNTFNTIIKREDIDYSITLSFKPYYKWNTFNT